MEISGTGVLLVGLATSVIAAIVGGIVGAVRTARAQAQVHVERDLLGHVVPMFYALWELRDLQAGIASCDGHSYFAYQGKCVELGQLLRQFSIVSAQMPTAEREKAVGVYRMLTQLSNHSRAMKCTHDYVGPVMDLLVNAYPEALAHLQHDSEAHDDFHRLIGLPAPRRELVAPPDDGVLRRAANTAAVGE